MKLSIAEFPAALRVPVRHASATRRATENVICVAEHDGVVGVGEGGPRSYVTGETINSARGWLAEHAPAAAAAAATGGFDGLVVWEGDNRELIDRAPAAFCALELALLDLLARQTDESVEGLLGQPPLSGTASYTAVVGDSSSLFFKAVLARYAIGGFRDVKIKLSGDLGRDRAKMRWVRARRWRARADANNLWSTPDECIDHIRAIGGGLFAIEEPLQATDIGGFAEVAEALGTRIILDESGLRGDQLSELPGDPGRWILNCRVSKMGGLVRSLAAVAQAAEAGMGVIVGAQVGETSLLSRAALTAAAHAGPALLAQEGAFGTRLLERDLTQPSITFDRRGQLDVEQVVGGRPGLGLDFDRGLLDNAEDLTVAT